MYVNTVRGLMWGIGCATAYFLLLLVILISAITSWTPAYFYDVWYRAFIGSNFLSLLFARSFCSGWDCMIVLLFLVPLQALFWFGVGFFLHRMAVWVKSLPR